MIGTRKQNVSMPAATCCSLLLAVTTGVARTRFHVLDRQRLNCWLIGLERLGELRIDGRQL
jgi:hypothetical protein